MWFAAARVDSRKSEKPVFFYFLRAAEEMAKLQKDTVSDGVPSFAEMNQSPGNKQSRFDAASRVVLDLPNVKAPSHLSFFFY